MPTNKILWPEDKYTKQDLLDYYDHTAPYILPYLKDRPLVLKRFPNGIAGPSFFQKNMKGDLPEYVHTVSLPTKTDAKEVRYVVCNNKETLHYLAHLDTIELHPWGSRVPDVTHADYMIFDLDPGPETTFADVVTIAQLLHEILDTKKLLNVCKTSGKRGLHIYVPVHTSKTYTQVREEAQAVAAAACVELPELASLEHWPDKRKDKIYIDIMRNAYGQTAVAPYSIRAISGAPVSTPLFWEEVSNNLNPHEYTIKTIFTRLEHHGDPWQKLLHLT